MSNWSSLKFCRKWIAARQHEEVRERDAGDEQERHQQHQRQRDRALRGENAGSTNAYAW